MKNFLYILICLTFLSSSAWADEVLESMEAALAAQSVAEPTTAPVAPVVPESYEDGLSKEPADMNAPQAEIPEEVAPEATEEISEPEVIKARDILPKEDQRAALEEVHAEEELLDEFMVGEEGEPISTKSLLLEDSAKSGVLMLADFDAGDKPNNLGGDFGGWDKDPSDDTQTCRATFASADSTDNLEGFALRLDYDVDSPRPAYNGFWMKLENVDATPYDTLVFDIRGASHRFTKRVKVELKTPDNRSSYFFVSGIKSEWQTIQIPLKRFKGIKDWATMGEFGIVFDDVNTAPKRGTLLVDQIRFERMENGMPQKNKEKAKSEYYLEENQGSQERLDELV